MSLDTGKERSSSAIDDKSRQWTARARRAAESAFPPERILPDRQPAYMASWIYVFGVLTVVSLAWVIITGCVLAIMGPSWWHVSTTGHFVNSLHLWSVEAFFFFMVIHLWGKFFMAAWRGNRRLTWVTGVISFVISVAAAFTGYLSAAELRFPVDLHPGQGRHQRNRGRRLFQRLELRADAHVAHRPAPHRRGVSSALHVLLVRRRGIVPPFADRTTSRDATPDRARRSTGRRAVTAPRGRADSSPTVTSPSGTGAYVPYDILKEVVRRLPRGRRPRSCSWLSSSPPRTTGHHAQDLVHCQPGRLRPDRGHRARRHERHRHLRPALQRDARLPQHIGFFEPAQWFGVHHPINTAQDFVIGPLGPCPTSRSCRPPRRVRRCIAHPAGRMDHGLREGCCQRDRCRRPPACSFGPLWPGRRRHRLPDRHGTDRGPRRHAAERGPVLQHQLHQAAALHRRRHIPSNLAGPNTSRAASGE